MMSVTHIAIATAATALGLGTSDPWCLVAAAIGSQLPDLDSTQSIMGRLVYPIASWLENRFPHRGPTHSFLSTGATAIVFLPLGYFVGWQYWGAVCIGQFVGWFADCFTKSGVQAFWPQDVWLVIPGNPRARLNTHSPAEYWILSLAIVLTISSVNIASAGGISEQFAALLFQNSEVAADAFQKYGSTQRVYAVVEGTNAATGEVVNDRFEVLDTIGTAIIGEIDGRRYKIGEGTDADIRPQRVKVEKGKPLTITSETSSPEEMPFDEWIQSIPKNAYLSGTLLIDDAEEIRLSNPPDQYSSVQVGASGVILFYAKSEDLTDLNDFWILSGNVIVKVRT